MCDDTDSKYNPFGPFPEPIDYYTEEEWNRLFASFEDEYEDNGLIFISTPRGNNPLYKQWVENMENHEDEMKWLEKVAKTPTEKLIKYISAKKFRAFLKDTNWKVGRTSTRNSAEFVATHTDLQGIKFDIYTDRSSVSGEYVTYKTFKEFSEYIDFSIRETVYKVLLFVKRNDKLKNNLTLV